MTYTIEIVLETIVENYIKILKNNLNGIYLHGSLAMDCFNSKKSDIDLLIVVEDNITHEDKKKIIDGLINIEKDISRNCIEMSIVLEEKIKHFQPPMDFILHYSKVHKDKYLENGFMCEDSKDPDLTAHLAIINARGKCLYGKAIDELGINISEEEFIDSIIDDLNYSSEDISIQPEYVILNLCRTLKHLDDKTFSSKLEGGNWAKNRYGVRIGNVISEMLYNYTSTDSSHIYNENENKYAAGELLKLIK